MAKTYSLRTKFTMTIAFAVLLTVALASVLANVLLNRQFVRYITVQQQQKARELATSLGQQYHPMTGEWDVDFIHTIGMYALYDGYIINVLNPAGQSIWDAQSHDMSACAQVMSEIKTRMEKKYPGVDGSFVSQTYPLAQNGVVVGSVEISYFGPFFLSEEDFNFLQTLNATLAGAGLFALAAAVLVGGYMAARLSRPILKTAEVSRRMADGDYRTRMQEPTNTKELDQLMGSINHLAATLEGQETLRKQLTADVAHELRTPLHTVGMQLEAMMEGVWQPTPQRLQSCYEEVARIGALVQDLENLARVESGNLKLERLQVDYWTLVDKTLESLGLEVAQKDLVIHKEGGALAITADPGRWRQVVHNLLANAIKYTPSGGEITVTVAREDGEAVLTVRDTGIGIPGEDLPFIFERFYRAEKSRSRTSGGAGIGLAVVKSIVEAHGGTVTADSVAGEGSVFRVALPEGGHGESCRGLLL